ncbi:hypothetical protein OCAR_4868 [Afipia carboxidovorans OM5]|nr:hypothetical protein OCAR_4868 [Afipia carboxidovorans OM5]
MSRKLYGPPMTFCAAVLKDAGPREPPRKQILESTRFSRLKLNAMVITKKSRERLAGATDYEGVFLYLEF